MRRPPGVFGYPFMWYEGHLDTLNHQMDATISYPIPNTLLTQFQGKLKDIRCGTMIKKGYGETSGGPLVPFLSHEGHADLLNNQIDARVSFLCPKTLIYSFSCPFELNK